MGSTKPTKLIPEKAETALIPVSANRRKKRKQEIQPSRVSKPKAKQSIPTEVLRAMIRNEVQAFKTEVRKVIWKKTKTFGQQLVLELASLVCHWPDRWKYRRQKWITKTISKLSKKENK